MNTLVVYDSYFGNTEQIAKAMGQALTGMGPVEVLPADQVTAHKLHGLNVLIAGSPTRQFHATEGITTLLKSLAPNELNGVRVAAFDTRLALDKIESGVGRWFVKTGGFAAKGIARLLTDKGGTLAAPPEGFNVDGEKGPLSAGELERAGAWARQVAGSQGSKL